MAFSFYQSLRSVPSDLDEVTRGFALSPVRRFLRLDLPFATPALVWNDDVHALQLLRFAELQGADIILTAAARRYAQAYVDARKAMFAQALLAYVPLGQHIRRILDERAGHVAPARRFRDELEDHMSEDYAGETLRTITHWGRYAEVFAYDEDADRFSLEDAL